MAKLAAFETGRPRSVKENPPFRFVAIYEGVSAGAQAALRMAPLLARVKQEFEVQTSFWTFDEIERFPERIDQATREMVEADLIVVSTQSRAGLEPRFKNWIEGWARRKQGNPCALVALLGPGNPTRPEPSLRSFLQRMAESGGMDFFFATVAPQAEQLEAGE